MSELQSQVMEFHRTFDHPIARSPTVPLEERVRFRARLIVEECIEMIEAVFDLNSRIDKVPSLRVARTALDNIIENAAVKVHLSDFVDALADIDYVVEGARLEFGVDGKPIAREVHRSNMAKMGGTKRADGKTLKPPDWTPPDIVGELARQRLHPMSLMKEGTVHVHKK